MDSEDLYPNDGAAFTPTESVEQVIGRQTEKSETLQALPMIQKMLKRWDKQIKLLKSIDSIPKELRMDPQKFMNTVNANDISVRFLQSEKEWMEDLIERHFKR